MIDNAYALFRNSPTHFCIFVEIHLDVVEYRSVSIFKMNQNFENIKSSIGTVLDCFEKLNFKLLIFSLKKGNSRVRFKKA